VHADDRVSLTRADLRYLMRQYADARRSRREAALHYAYPITMVLALGLSGVAIARDWPVAACFVGLLVPMAVGQAWARARAALAAGAVRVLLPGVSGEPGARARGAGDGDRPLPGVRARGVRLVTSNVALQLSGPRGRSGAPLGCGAGHPPINRITRS
jgi:hypothetical protein